jgi:hypothetical protein
MTTAVQVQYRRDTAANVAAFTGAAGEMVVDTTNHRLVVQDGATAGGYPAAKLSETITNTRAAVADAGYTALATDRLIAYTSITAARTVALPASSAFPTGTRLLVIDESGSCSAINTIKIAANGTDKINGYASVMVGTPYGYLALESNGAGKWTIVDNSGRGVLLNVLVASNSAALQDTTSLTAAFEAYEIELINILPATATSAYLQVHSGGAYQTSSYNANYFLSTAGSTGNTNISNALPLSGTAALSNVQPGLSGSVKIYGPSGTSVDKQMVGETTNSGTNNVVTILGGYWQNTAAVDGFQVVMSTGNITSGLVRVWGLG